MMGECFIASGAMSLEDAIRLEDRNQAMCIAQLAAQADENNKGPDLH